jgi:mannose-6-phosphate isomerase
MPKDNVDAALKPLLDRIIPAYKENRLDKSAPDFWAARAATTFFKDEHLDRGIFSVYLFNLLHLRVGEAIYQPAGMPHAYLEGQNVEVMANSDNVLRAGLTDKHVDVDELMKHVRFEATYPNVLPARQASEQAFEAPVQEFHLKKYTTQAGLNIGVASATIVFATDGTSRFEVDGKAIDIKRGEAVLLLPGTGVSVQPSGNAFTCFLVSTPMDKI